jgi:hypothetical protein
LLPVKGGKSPELQVKITRRKRLAISRIGGKEAPVKENDQRSKQ